MSLQTETLQKPASQPPWKRFVARREISLLAVLAFLFIVFSVLSDRFASVNTVGQILNNMAIVVIVGIGLALVLLTRNIDVSVGSMVGLTAYFAADFAVKNPQLPIIVVVLASCLLGLVLGSINGVIIATLRVPSIMVTLGTLYIYRGIDSILAGSNQVTAQSLPSGYGDLASWSLFGIPGLVIYAFVIAIAAHIFVRHTFAGRSLLAIGSNPIAAEKMGIPAKRRIFAAFAISGLFCGLAGVLWGARYGTVDSSVASGYEIVVLAAVVVGGISVNGGSGTIGGVIIGAAILSVISTGLALVNVSQFWLQAIQGAVIIAAIVSDSVIRTRVEARGVKA
ncbi:ABC transporter permease [Arthrobacter sp. NPDC057013]|uniref:ABC transporter permease n=1 Tax=Arthrobacter sp. NPDC057013 TaxID=3345999 RepID=UPI00362EFF3A